jgi:hypothetical protein
MPFGDRNDHDDDANASLALLSAEEADDAAADRRLRPAADAEEESEHRSTLLTVTPYILGNEFCERLAYYGCVRPSQLRAAKLSVWLRSNRPDGAADAHVNETSAHGILSCTVDRHTTISIRKELRHNLLTCTLLAWAAKSV